MLSGSKLQGSAKELYNRLFTGEFDKAALRKELEAGMYDAETVNVAAFGYVADCACQLQEAGYDKHRPAPGETISWIESGHMAEALALLLDYGLDPNRIFREEQDDGWIEEYNIMKELELIDNGYQGADSLYLLLSHGGDPNLEVNGGQLLSETHYEFWTDNTNRRIWCDEFCENKIHSYMVLVGFGAGQGQGNQPLVPVDGFDVSKLREHRNYYAGVIYSDKCNHMMELVFFDRYTNWEVARL